MISTRSLWFGYPGGQRIGFPDIEVAQGGTLVLRGPSGAGKSTWLALVAGLQVPESGHLHVAHTDLRTLTAAGRDAWRARHVGFLPQRLHLSEALDVQGNLALAWFAAGRPADGFALRLDGFVHCDHAGIHAFTLESDDGSTLEI
ncbi:MAG: ATP-binding cassette domain-containing protein, partial [Betaproteobacteria bacterium]|nr:ATP-binding cassette domain-containing protein [Betaproteobacteria bacterium]